jgi:hypothetical protein
MSPSADAPSHDRLHDLEVEVRVLRRTLAQREEALGALNRRLLVLERGDIASPVVDRSDEVVRLEAEIEQMRNTKLFRWSAPARDLYRRLRSGPAR